MTLIPDFLIITIWFINFNFWFGFGLKFVLDNYAKNATKEDIKRLQRISLEFGIISTPIILMIALIA
jgi:hypothetical protein